MFDWTNTWCCAVASPTQNSRIGGMTRDMHPCAPIRRSQDRQTHAASNIFCTYAEMEASMEREETSSLTIGLRLRKCTSDVCGGGDYELPYRTALLRHVVFVLSLDGSLRWRFCQAGCGPLTRPPYHIATVRVKGVPDYGLHQSSLQVRFPPSGLSFRQYCPHLNRVIGPLAFSESRK